ncbi:MAG: HAMP domain-containing histidine kinase [Spirochaetales bacterium]|jgi:signal transduction histidine kinase|nr:HAMP domain-containing histidine kinase [Spirochaetales bacterium]
MRKSLLIVFLLLIVAPIGVISWLSYSSFARERENNTERYSILARRQLEEIDRLIQSHILKVEAELLQYDNAPELDIAERRRISRSVSTIRQLFIIDEENIFVFPPESGDVSAQEARFLEEAGDLELPLVLGPRTVEGSSRSGGEQGWYTWFMGDGINLIFWQITDSGNLFGIMLDRIALISGISAMLPDSDYTITSEFQNRILLTDARGNSLYQWGLYSPPAGESPVAELGLSAPLGAWHLHLYLDLESEGDKAPLGRYFPLFPGVAAVILIVILLAAYFFRENRKLIREALQKVSFVNQVSHELRTPLTNIRLYTELLASRLTDPKDLDHIGVVTAESQRLSRMIGNVLTFSRSGRDGFVVNISEIVIDDVVRRVIESFSPSLDQKSIDVVLQLDASRAVQTDVDFVEQILSNLVGNVEKYASGGGYLEIVTVQSEGIITVSVKDRGPGIPIRERKNIFKPFYRISNRLTDGVSGAGIGLAISRMLAEKLGGELHLDAENPGALFRFTLVNELEGEES